MHKELLELVARMSPKRYADIILKRNEDLATSLILLKVHLGKNYDELPFGERQLISGITWTGCPHCLECNGTKCSGCIWEAAIRSRDDRFGIPEQSISGDRLSVRLPCAFVEFNHEGYRVFLRQMSFTSVRVSYGCSHENLAVGRVPVQMDWDRAWAFVQGHIAWAKLDCWGESYKPGEFKEK